MILTRRVLWRTRTSRALPQSPLVRLQPAYARQSSRTVSSSNARHHASQDGAQTAAATTTNNTATTSQPPGQPPSVWRIWWRALQVLIGGSVALHIGTDHGLSLKRTWGVSMLPTMPSDGAWVVMSKYYRRGRAVAVGDLVSFRHPLDEDATALKRVLAMPGDFVLRDSPDLRAQRDAVAEVQGKGRMPVPDGGGAPTRRPVPLMLQVPPGHCYLVGDNLTMSRDSRLYGPIPLALIQAKCIYTVVRTRLGLPWLKRVPPGLVDLTNDLDSEP